MCSHGLYASLCSGTLFEGGSVDVFTMVKNIDYPRDPQTHMITAAVHPDLQVGKHDCLCGNVAADVVRKSNVRLNILSLRSG